MIHGRFTGISMYFAPMTVGLEGSRAMFVLVISRPCHEQNTARAVASTRDDFA